jgi:hypothetical protein
MERHDVMHLPTFTAASISHESSDPASVFVPPPRERSQNEGWPEEHREMARHELNRSRL